MALLETEKLVKEFMRGGYSFPAVNEIDFSIEKGDFIHIIGRSGGGKTTFLNLISGILKPTRGRVLAEGKDLENMDDEQKSYFRNSFVGYVPQSMGTMPNLTVLDNVRLPHYLFNREGDGIGRASILLDWMGILHLKDEFTGTISGGEMKRVLLARALMNEPQLLIADEPTADLDSETTKEIMQILKKINQDSVSIIVVTHEVDVLEYGDKVLVMEDGKLTERNNIKAL